MNKIAIKPANAPAAIGPYSPAVKLSNFVYLSGQIPVDPVTNEIVEGGIGPQTHMVMQNIVTILEELGLETRHIMKTTVYLSDMNNFAEMNKVYSEYFEEPYPARSAVEVGALPKGALVEIECLVIDTLDIEAAEQQDVGCCSGCCGR